MRGGLPHSEIQGSTIARISPWLIAACHVLHRLSVPRHPPDALTLTLDRKTRRLQGQAQSDRSRMKTLSCRRLRGSITLELPHSPCKRSCRAEARQILSPIDAGRQREADEPGGGERNRTVDLLLAKQALSQLSYTPRPGARRQGSGRLAPRPWLLNLVGQGGFEPPTSRLSSARSNQLSY
jgi:hypothetical protein